MGGPGNPETRVFNCRDGVIEVGHHRDIFMVLFPAPEAVLVTAGPKPALWCLGMITPGTPRRIAHPQNGPEAAGIGNPVQQQAHGDADLGYFFLALLDEGRQFRVCLSATRGDNALVGGMSLFFIGIFAS